MNAQKTSSAVVANELVFPYTHGFAPNTPLTYADNGVATITGLTDGTTYFVLAGGTALTMKLSATSGGSVLTISGGAAGNSVGLQFFKEWTVQLCPGTEGTTTNKETFSTTGYASDCQAIANVPEMSAFKNVQIPLGDKLYIYGAGAFFSTDATTSHDMKLSYQFVGNAFFLTPCFPAKDVRDTTSKTVFWGRRRRLDDLEDDMTDPTKMESAELFPMTDPIASPKSHRRWLAEYCPKADPAGTTSAPTVFSPSGAVATSSSATVASILAGLALVVALTAY